MLHQRLADTVAAIHVAMIPYCLLGWAVPHPTWLKVHAAFVPLMMVHWRLNRDVCILTNLESYLRHGEWWRSDDRDQDRWVKNQIERCTGWAPPPRLTDGATYAALAAATFASLIHLWLLEARP